MFALFLLAACSPEPEADPARPFEYQVWFDSDLVAPQSKLSFAGQQVGSVTRIKDWAAGDPSSMGTVTLPMNWDHSQSLFLEISTPCGNQELALEVVAPPTSAIQVQTPDAVATRSEVYQSWGPGVRIGEMALESSQGQSWSAAGLNCADEHTVYVNDQAVGSFKTPAELDYLFLPQSDSECYVFSAATFSKEGGSLSETALSGAWGYGLPGRVAHYMERVPDTLRVDQIEAQVGVASTYLSQVECSPSGQSQTSKPDER